MKTNKIINPQRLISIAITLIIVAAAIWAGLRLWDRYELAPWTRDGRVRANIVQIAPDVSGLVTAVPIRDNEPVAAGTLLFEVDRARYELALRQAQTQLATQHIALIQAQRENVRNAGLGNLVSQEAREQTQTRMEQAQTAVAQAMVSVDTAKLNLARAQVHTPTAGVITNLDLRLGSYATAGHPVLALVDTQSLYVEGYFEETKLARIHIGDPVRIAPMGTGKTFSGTVESLTAAIADHDRVASPNLLPSINPNFNWVRLPQRVPVRVRLNPLPAGETLVAGQTVTVEVLAAPRTAAAQPAHKGV
jgi:multidrug resistance efflux pump